MEFKLDDDYFIKRINESVASYPWPPSRMKQCLDVGGNVGAFSLLVSEYCDQVISFEPYKPNYDFMNNKIKELGITNIVTYNKALHNTHNIDLTMTVLKEGTDSKDISTTKHSHGKTVKLGNTKTFGVSNLMEQYSEIDYMKVDCEGCEYDILMNQDLSKVKILVLEIHGGYIGNDKTTELLDYLKSQFPNYNVRELNEFYVFTSSHFSTKEGGTMLMDDDGMVQGHS